MLARADAPIVQFERWLGVAVPNIDIRVNHRCGAVIVSFDPERSTIPAEIENKLAELDLRSLKSAAVCNPNPSTAGIAETTPAGNWWQSVASGQWTSLALASAGVAFSLIPGGSCALAAIGCSLTAAIPSFQRAICTLRDERRLNVDFLDSLAIAVATAQGRLFTSAFMTWLLALGDWIRDQTGAKSRRAIIGLLDYQTRHAWVRRGDERVSVPVSEIQVGEIVIAYDGDLIPVDGRVVSGAAMVDQRAITGESMPEAKRRHSRVYAASVVQEGKLYVRTERTAAESLLAEVVRMVESAPVGETRMQNYAEKFADRLVIPTLGLSGLLYLGSGDLNRALSALIVDFGTGIRVAAPTSVLASISAAVRQGILIRGGRALEQLSEIDSVVFDKTGTLTVGAPIITEIVSCNERAFPSRKILEIAAAAEMRLKHPVALATIAKAREAQLTIPPRTRSRYQIGRGVEARVNGYFVHVGSERFLHDNHIHLNGASSYAQLARANGQSSLMVAVDGETVGQLVYADQIRRETPAVIQALKDRSIPNLVMLTGDNGATAQHVASRLGITELHAEILPHEKAEIVQALRTEGRRVAMVGDGINDAVALSYADVGIAMKNGSELAQQSAHVVLMKDDLMKLVTALDLARSGVKLIHQNYAIVVGLNVLALAMAMVGGTVVPPELTALISNGSAVTASLNGLRPLIQ